MAIMSIPKSVSKVKFSGFKVSEKINIEPLRFLKKHVEHFFKLSSQVPGLSVVVTSKSIELCVVIFKSGGCVKFSDII